MIKAASPTCAASWLSQEQHTVGEAKLSSGLERSDRNQSSEPDLRGELLASGAECT